MSRGTTEFSRNTAMSHPPGESQSRFSPFLILLAASLLFRLPPLLNSNGVHSDAAVVGLQARHILAGEWSWFLWGAGYQGSVEALLIALGFAVAGATPLTLMVMLLIGHLGIIWFTFDILRRRIGARLAVIASLPLVFTPLAINGPALFPQRQWCITFIFAAIWLLDGASESRRSLTRYAAAGAVTVLALYQDLYVLQFMIAMAVLAVTCSLDGEAGKTMAWRRLRAGALGFAGAMGLFCLIRQAPHDRVVVTRLALHEIPDNWQLLWDKCLPWLLSYKVFIPGPDLAPDFWEGPASFRLLQIVGACCLMGGVLLGSRWLFVVQLPWRVRRLGLFGFLVSVSSLSGFLLSPAPRDAWAARYLAPIIWTAPLALAPTAHALGQRRFGLLLLPYLAAATVAGWLGYVPSVRTPVPGSHSHSATRSAVYPEAAYPEERLAAFLRCRGIAYGAAPYWVAYRLTFLFAENPIIVPLEPGEDRYQPYRHGFETTPTVAYIFHPSQPALQPQPYERDLRAQGFASERVEIAGFTVLIVDRTLRASP